MAGVNNVNLLYTLFIIFVYNVCQTYFEPAAP